MDYHADRFNDHSLIICKDHQWVCCLPAHIKEGTLNSHSGLTYGGLVFGKVPESNLIEGVLKAILTYLDNTGNFQLIFKQQPSIYNPSHQSVIQQLLSIGFVQKTGLLNMHFDLEHSHQISSKKTAGYRNGKFSSLTYHWDGDITRFYHELLVPSLKERHQTAPTHSLAELQLLKSRFPENIKLASVYIGEQLLAGVLFFLKSNIAKSQYAAASMDGMKAKAMDYLYLESYEKMQSLNMNILDFGTVNNPDGSINIGLQRFKSELGAIAEEQLTLEYHAS